MKDRIRQYIERKGVSAGELAVMLDVQRSNISHILNGRNKPGAVFIEKLLLVFPDLNARWLLTGGGNMIDGMVNNKVENVKPVTNTLPFKTLDAPAKKEQNNLHIEKVEMQDPIVEDEDDLDRMVLLFKDGTFTTFKKR